MLKSLKLVEFKNKHGADCSLELFQSENHTEIEMISGDNVAHAVLIFDENAPRRIVDYSGVYSMPQRCIDLLNACGYDTAAIE